MTSLTQLTPYLNRDGMLHHEQFQFLVHITDVRTNFGRIQFLVTPANGTGTAWVEQSRVTLIGGKKKNEIHDETL